MNTLKDFVNWKLTHADKIAEAEGYPLVMENCKKNKRMKQLEIYGNSVQDGTPTPEEPIEVQSVGELVTDTNDVNYGKYKVPIVTRGNNLIDSDLWLNYFDKLEDGSYHSKGIITQTTKVPLSLKANTYTISLDIKCPTGTNYRLYMFDANNNELYVWNIKSGTGKWKNIKHTFTTNVDVSYVGWIYSAISDDVSFRNLQVVKGAENLTYEPYIEPTTTNVFLNEPLRKIGDYADYIDFKNKKVIRNTFVRIYDGYNKTDNPFNKSDNEENWAGSENHGDLTENFWLYTLNDTLPIIPKNGHHSANDYKQVPMCLQLPVKTGYYDANTSDATIDKEMIWFCQQGRGVRLYLSKDRVGSKRSNLITYLRSNPISVTIATYQPFEEPLNMELPKLNAKTTIIEVDTNLSLSNAKGKYIKK